MYIIKTNGPSLGLPAPQKTFLAAAKGLTANASKIKGPCEIWSVEKRGKTVTQELHAYFEPVFGAYE